MGYDPTIGAWIEADPEEYIDGPNRYQFEISDPTALVDPSGLDAAAATQAANAPTPILPITYISGPTIDLLSAEFPGMFMTADHWGQSGFNPVGGDHILSEHDTLQLTDESAAALGLTGNALAEVRELISTFNQLSAEHEEAIAELAVQAYSHKGAPLSEQDQKLRMIKFGSSVGKLDKIHDYLQRNLIMDIIKKAGMAKGANFEKFQKRWENSKKIYLKAIEHMCDPDE